MHATNDAGEPPARIWVVGPCGAGKSTVGLTLATRMGVELTCLDALNWRPGWQEAEPEELAADVDEVVRRPHWVIEGNYPRVGRCHMDRVQLFVWLDLPLSVTFPRLVRRGVHRSIRRVPCCNGNYETLRRTFFHPDSLLWWALTSDRPRRRRLTRELRLRPHVRLRSQRAIDRWLQGGAPVRSDGHG